MNSYGGIKLADIHKSVIMATPHINLEKIPALPMSSTAHRMHLLMLNNQRHLYH